MASFQATHLSLELRHVIIFPTTLFSKNTKKAPSYLAFRRLIYIFDNSEDKFVAASMPPKY